MPVAIQATPVATNTTETVAKTFSEALNANFKKVKEAGENVEEKLSPSSRSNQISTPSDAAKHLSF